MLCCLYSQKEKLHYSYNVGPELPSQLVIFTLGSWDVILKDFQPQAVLLVQIQLKNGTCLHVGQLNFHHRYRAYIYIHICPYLFL